MSSNDAIVKQDTMISFLQSSVLRYHLVHGASWRSDSSRTSLAIPGDRRKDRFGRKGGQVFFRVSLAILVFSFVATASAHADRAIAIPLSQLPAPPPELEALINAGSVTFETGIRDLERVPPPDPKIIGETRYKVAYTYKSRAKWRINNFHRRLTITVRFQRVEWKPTHVIWLRDVPPSEEFWEGSTLLHEFDHVRISSDERMAKRFAELLRERSVFHHELQPGERVNQGVVDRLVERHVETIFNELADLIAIRYVELDRETKHGTRLLPESSELYSLLRGDSKTSTLSP